VATYFSRIFFQIPPVFFQKPILKGSAAGREQASKQARNQASQLASKQTSQQGKGGREDSQPASQQT